VVPKALRDLLGCKALKVYQDLLVRLVQPARKERPVKLALLVLKVPQALTELMVLQEQMAPMAHED
jgi:hypothetical protein